MVNTNGFYIFLYFWRVEQRYSFHKQNIVTKAKHTENRALSRQRKEQGQRSGHPSPLWWYVRCLFPAKRKLHYGLIHVLWSPPPYSYFIYQQTMDTVKSSFRDGCSTISGSKGSLCSPGTSSDTSSVCVSSCRIKIWALLLSLSQVSFEWTS